jgi:antitoxin (DNA-binding transcriptional repressor) of toxin-antitoxin stability system
MGMDLNATELRRRILSLLDDLPEEGIIITKRGQTLARLVPLRRRRTGRYVTAPLIQGKGSPGPLCPTSGNPYDLLFD